ncbi:MAG: GreA/GreB family elongation factor [Alphaproteobacteria bacterium]|nr:GreA/GreB family elongation factor [Alphaproteobacteria bacterium]
MPLDKPSLIAAWRAELEQRREVLRRGQAEARAGTRVDGDHRPANRGERGAVTAQGYLAQALQQRISELEEQLRLLDEVGVGPRDRVVVGALVTLEDEAGAQSRLLILPGGDASALADGAVRVLSGSAPMARALKGLTVGEVAELRVGGGVRALEVVEVV